MMSHERRAIASVATLLSLSLSLAVACKPTTQSESPAKIDYAAKLNELVRKGSDESQNAEPFYQKASALCVRSLPAHDVWAWPTDWSSEEQASMKEWVKANADALGQLRLGTQRPSYWFRFEGRSVWEMDRLSYWQTARLLVFALTDRTKLEATEGNTQDAVEDFLTGCCFALDVRRRLLLMEQLVGIAATNHILHAGFATLGRSAFDPSALQRLQDRLMELSQDPAWFVDLRAEEIATLEMVQEIHARAQGRRDKKNMELIDRALASQGAAVRGRDLEFELTAERAYASARNHTLEELVTWVREGYAYYHRIVTKTPFRCRQEAIRPHQKWTELVCRNTLLYALAPDAPRVSELSFRCAAQRDALITTLALLRHKHDKDSFPTCLQELVSGGYITQVPMDPYGDKPLVYKRTENSFLLYSLGVDLEDGGGKHDRRWGEGTWDGDYVFWPVQVGSAREP